MKSCVNLEVRIEGARRQINSIAGAISSVITDVTFSSEELIQINGTEDIRGTEDLIKLARRMVVVAPKSKFTITGELSDKKFKFTYDSDVLMAQYSDCDEASQISLDMSDEIEDMVADLEEFYECAGFEDYYDRVLKNLNEDEIIEHFRSAFYFEEN